MCPFINFLLSPTAADVGKFDKRSCLDCCASRTLTVAHMSNSSEYESHIRRNYLAYVWRTIVNVTPHMTSLKQHDTQKKKFMVVICRCLARHVLSVQVDCTGACCVYLDTDANYETDSDARTQVQRLCTNFAGCKTAGWIDHIHTMHNAVARAEQCAFTNCMSNKLTVRRRACSISAFARDTVNRVLRQCLARSSEPHSRTPKQSIASHDFLSAFAFAHNYSATFALQPLGNKYTQPNSAIWKFRELPHLGSKCQKAIVPPTGLWFETKHICTHTLNECAASAGKLFRVHL